MYDELEIIGNLVADPDSRFTPQGTQVTNFRVAVNRWSRDADGSRNDYTVWYRVAAWGNQAEACNKYLSKGRLVQVKGQLVPGEGGNPRVFQKSDGTWGATYEVRARIVNFLGGKSDDTGGQDSIESQEVDETDSPF